MSSPRPFEQALLQPANDFLECTTAHLAQDLRYEARLQILEAASGRLGTFSVREYFKLFEVEPLFAWAALDTACERLVAQFRDLPMHPSLALSALAREPLTTAAQREAGSYYTDFRLATLVAELAQSVRVAGRPVIDPACGAGILLCALTLAVCGHDRKKASSWLANHVHAADASPLALRGAALSLASFTDDLAAIRKMRSHWFCGDTLLRPESEWSVAAPGGYGCVVANPPWEKVKATRHEFAKANGVARHYGADHASSDLLGYERAKSDSSSYSKELAKRYPLIAGGEVDLYAAFTELCIRLARDGGGVAALLPGGLIRSQSTEGLRRELVDSFEDLSVGVLENRARFFGIDTRFKFLAVAGRTKNAGVASQRTKHLQLNSYKGTEAGCVLVSGAKLPLSTLENLRGDLSIPEVRSAKEWKLFVKACNTGVSWAGDDGPWQVRFAREVDMTKSRPHFHTEPSRGSLPVVEGRMVHHHRFGAKAFVSGSGRAAVWDTLPFGASQVRPQFWISPGALPVAVQERATRYRAGFCDIAGQTNERSMMSAVIPAGVVCGNKVPTVEFAGPKAEDDMWLWVGLTNSLPFDWLLRRVLTTTVNYFLLRSIPLPAISSNSLPGRRIVEAAKELARLDVQGTSRARMLRAAELRAQIDVLALTGYGATFDDLQMMLTDFPLLDRGQPPLAGESRSTITTDFLLFAAAKRFKKQAANLATRVQHAINGGAMPYVPAISAGEEAELTQYAAG